MTKQEFKNLKIGDGVALKNTRNDSYIGTEVLNIDRYHNKLEVLLGRKKWYSYKYIKKSAPFGKYNMHVGVCK